MKPEESLLYTLLRLSVGKKAEIETPIALDVWENVYELARKQTLEAVVFSAIEKLPKLHLPPHKILFKWYALAEQTKQDNIKITEATAKVEKYFSDNGLNGCILKGQGIAQLYPNPSLRVAGDVDLWLCCSRREITSFIERNFPINKIGYLHAEVGFMYGASVEVHYIPSWMNSIYTNIKLQKYFKQQLGLFEKIACVGTEELIHVPTLAFNRVYILVHIFRHLFCEGVGLRQIMDYYYVLKQGFTEDERKETMRVLSSLKMQRFAGAVMWVLQYVFGLEDQYLLVSPDEKEGRFLLDEIMLAGNMGQYDKRINRAKNKSQFGRFVMNVKRNFRFVRSYPSEVLWSPFFKIWHFFWRKAYAFKYKQS